MSLRLVPFVFGHGAWCAAWRERIDLRSVGAADCDAAVAIDVLDDDAVSFFAVVNAANARAFSGLAMPAWVQLDCATLPTAMVGFAAKKRDLVEHHAALVSDVEARAGVVVDDDALVPLAEYCALPTPEAGHVVGFSLFSLLPGLGLRAKALGLLAMQAQVQTGVTQFDNTALSTHCRFGPLVVEKRSVQVHSKPGTTLVYRLQVPPPETLTRLAIGESRRVEFAGDTVRKASLEEGDVVVDVVVEPGVGRVFVVAVISG